MQEQDAGSGGPDPAGSSCVLQIQVKTGKSAAKRGVKVSTATLNSGWEINWERLKLFQYR